MIITRTPFRISFLGGATDFKYFYQNQPGEVVSSAINKYIYVAVNKRFEGDIRLSYAKTEVANHIDQLEHSLIREAMRLTGVDSGVNISVMADVPGKGTGIGSSSSLTIGVLNALYNLKGMQKTSEELAKSACKIEIDILGAPIGRQDQYITAFGGLKNIIFDKDEQVTVADIPISEEQKKELDSNLFLFSLPVPRQNNDVLARQIDNSKDKMSSLVKMRDLARRGKEHLMNKKLDEFGRLLHENWQEKRNLAEGITNPEIDSIYQRALDVGALGGKVCGAGGGGFLLLYCKKENQQKLRSVLADLKETPFSFEPKGSIVVYRD